MFIKLKGQFNYRTRCQDMEAACKDENILKILYKDILYLKMPGSPEGYTKHAFIKAVLKPEATIAAMKIVAAKNTNSTGKEKEKETEKGTDLTNKKLINK